MTMVNFRPNFIAVDRRPEVLWTPMVLTGLIAARINLSRRGAADVAELSAGDKVRAGPASDGILDAGRARAVPAVRHRAMDPGVANGAEDRPFVAPTRFHGRGRHRRHAAPGSPEPALPSPAS